MGYTGPDGAVGRQAGPWSCWSEKPPDSSGGVVTRPFLTIAIISSVRRILSVSAQFSLEELSNEQFNHAIIELGAEGSLILIVAIALFLVSRREGG